MLNLFKLITYQQQPMKNKPPIHTHPPLSILLIFITLITPSYCLLQISTLTISTQATYTIQLSQYSIIAPMGSIVQLQLTYDYNSDDLHAGVPYTGSPLADGFCPDDCALVAVAYSGFTFNITGMFPIANLNPVLRYSILAVMNPRVAVTVIGYAIRVIDLTGVVVHNQTASSRTFLAKTMACTATATDYTQIGFISTSLFTINPISNPRDQPLTFITIQFPTTWTSDPIAQTSVLHPDFYCLSTSQPNLVCQRNSQILSLSGLSYSPSMDIEVHSIKNPSLVLASGPLTITTLTSNRYKLDTCSVSVSGFTQDYLWSPKVTITYDSNTLISVNVSVIFPARKFAAGTVVLFGFPGELAVGSAVCKIYLGGIQLTGVLPGYIPATNSISVNPFTSFIFKPNLQLQCTNIARPRSAVTLPNVTITTTYGGNTIGSVSCCSTVLEGRASLNVVSIITDKPYLGTTNAQYLIKIITSVQLLSTDLLYVYFPKQFQLGTGTIPCTVVSPTAATTVPTCAVSAGNLIRISSFLSTIAPSPTQLTFTLSSLTNPSSNPSTTPFSIYLLTSTLQIIQYNPTPVVTISASIITTFTVSSINKITSARPVQYVFGFVTNGLLLINYYVVFVVPVDVGVDQSGIGCNVGGKVMPCWYDGTGGMVYVRIIQNVASNTVNVAVDGFVNPVSTAPTSTFSLRILSPTSSVIQISSPTLTTTLTMTTPTTIPTLYSCIIGNSPPANMFQLNTLHMIMITKIVLKSTYKISVSYNSSQLMTTGSCVCSTGFTCTFDTTNYIINIGNMTAIANSDTIRVNVTNVRGLTTSAQLTITIKDSNDYLIMQSTTTTTRYMLDLITYTLAQTSYIYSATTDLTIDYTLTSLSASSLTIPQSRISYILVYIPKQYTTSLTSNILNYTSLTGRITIPSITNPSMSSSTSSYFYLTAYSSSSQLLALSTSNRRFLPTCTLPCRTCTTSTNCLSCYSTNIQNILLTVGGVGSCVSHCPRFYYYDSVGVVCLQCDANCYQCDYGNAVKCLSCVTGKYLYEGDYKCYVDCPAGYYQYGLSNAGVCRQCPTQCQTCLNQTYCMTCSTALYLYNNKCISVCPPTTYPTSSPTLSCTQCPFPNCLQCTQTLCQACIPPYFLSSNQCVSSCPFPLLPTFAGVCKVCECLTCTNYANNCTTCTASKPYLYNNYCYAGCPTGMYAGALGICTSCNLNCVTCSSSSVCLVCKQGYAIISDSITNVSCILTSQCPNTTILTLSPTGIPSCLPCTSPCLTCSTSPTFCLTCQPSYNFHNNSCVLSCPSPYHSLNSQCKTCIPQCQQCVVSDPYNCTQCNANYLLYQSSCYTICPAGTYVELTSKRCLACANVCRTCGNATNCTACVDGYFLFNWFCYVACPTTPVYYYQYNGICSLCQPQCTSCLSTPIQCTSCSHPDYFYNPLTHQCTFQCLSPYYTYLKTCIQCQSPCLTCDTTYNACSSCTNSLFLYNGTCVNVCPNGYFGNSTTMGCEKCRFPCRVCNQRQCLLCESFAYMYQKECVIVCPQDMPYQQPGYCSDCIGIGFCARCGQSSTTGQQICSQCVYPYVLFQDNCLNSCPTNYTSTQQDNSLLCIKSPSYTQYLLQKQQYNNPIIPPFLTLGIYLLFCLVILLISYYRYRYTYAVGFMLGLLPVFDSLFSCYCMYFVYTRYEGEYVPVVPLLPFGMFCAAVVYGSVVMTVVYWLYVIRGVYLNDIRYQEWKSQVSYYWWTMIILMPVLGGPRIHKINYSKIFGLQTFSFRIVSVQKFYEEDIVIYCISIGDIIQITAVVTAIYNIFITYHGIMLLGYECIAIKVIMWLLTLYDLKKPDRGFFIGDQQQAEEQIIRQEEQEQKKLNRVDTQNFAKLVRTKSAQLIRNPKYFGNLDIDDFISVYNPDDYEEVIKVPNKKIQKNIYRGKYRKGRKITIEQKLHKFVDTIKPKPVINLKKVDSYLHKLIYWKPPEMKKRTPIKELPPSQESMLALLEKKQLQYKQDLDDIQLVEEEKSRKYYARPRYDQRTFLDDLDETIPNQTVQFFYPSHSIQNTAQKKDSLDFDDLMNLNYARKKHLAKQEHNELESKRKLHNQPQKKRRNLKGFGQMVLKNQF